MTDHIALKWLISRKDPREKLTRWVTETQDLDFVTEHRGKPELVVPDTRIHDSIKKALSQRCYQKMYNPGLRQGKESAETSVFRNVDSDFPFLQLKGSKSLRLY